MDLVEECVGDRQMGPNGPGKLEYYVIFFSFYGM